MSERSPRDARVPVIKAALDEARQRGDSLVGSDHLFLGLLHAQDPVVAQALEVDLEAARAALDALDRTALASIGLDVAGLQLASHPPSRKRPRLSSAARSVLHRAAKEAMRTKPRRHTMKHMLLALLACEPPDTAAVLMAQLRIDRPAVRKRLDQATT